MNHKEKAFVVITIFVATVLWTQEVSGQVYSNATQLSEEYYNDTARLDTQAKTQEKQAVEENLRLQIINMTEEAKEYYLKTIDITQACNEWSNTHAEELKSMTPTEAYELPCTKFFMQYANSLRGLFNNTELVQPLLEARYR